VTRPFSTLIQLQTQLRERSISATELTQFYLERIEQLNPMLNCYITVDNERALDQARVADQQLAQGLGGPLTGIPVAQKDIFCIEDHLTTAGSKMLASFRPPYTATSASKLEQAGAITLGKTNMDEFAMGSSNETSYFGPVKNPWDLLRIPGGSSGGSAAAVAAGLCGGSTGTDTGGSIRQPAAMCGLTGLKPTYGRISRWGMIAFASSLDQAGPMTRTAEDAALMLEHMAGYDPKDATSLDEPVPKYSQDLNQSMAGLRIGVCRQFFSEGLEDAVEVAIREALKTFEQLGATLIDIELPNVPLSVSAYYVIAPAECSANLSRFDGVRFGHRCNDPTDLQDLYQRSRGEGFGNEVKKRILVGTFALSAGYYDAFYRRAQQVRRLIKNDFVAAFDRVDLILGPTAPTPAFKLGEKLDDPVDMYLQDIFTISANLAGLPAMSIPAGQVRGLPIGLQLIGNYLQEGILLRAGHQFQQSTDWHQLTPVIEL
jgi:aspartyl-tRNA(Asn)/glutamyl-tRNA(Gln) amidotransferase subunit A